MGGIPLRKIDQIILSISSQSWHGFQAVCQSYTLGISEEDFGSLWEEEIRALDKGAQDLRLMLPVCSQGDLRLLDGSLRLVLRALDSILTCWSDLDPNLRAAAGNEIGAEKVQAIKEKFIELFEDVSEGLSPHFASLIKEAISSLPRTSPVGHDWRKKINQL